MAFTYALYLLLALVGALAFMRVYSISFSRKQLKATRVSLALTIILFAHWDMWAVSRGHWAFNPETVLGFWIGNQPLEEILFFLIIPFFGIVLYEIFRARSVRR